jgi:hypothetical protein
VCRRCRTGRHSRLARLACFAGRRPARL